MGRLFRKKELKCNEVLKMIPTFLKREMKGKDVMRFTEHISSCPSCKEELAIEYLASEGLNFLESGASFNLEKELGAFIEDSVMTRHVRVRIRTAMAIYEAVALLIIISIYMITGS